MAAILSGVAVTAPLQWCAGMWVHDELVRLEQSQVARPVVDAISKLSDNPAALHDAYTILLAVGLTYAMT
ncbi:MAG: hypothetical protein ABIH92_03415, partial [Nanoarchaeota archaeon]